jgi:hypothetical protein
MKSIFLPRLLLLFSAGIVIISCKKPEILTPSVRPNPTDTVRLPSTKDTVYLSPTTPSQSQATFASCPNRPVVKVDLVPVGSLSIARFGMSAAAVSSKIGSKILFAGGFSMGAYSSRVDIYDMITKNWFTAELSETARQGMAVATLGSKIFFAGGFDADNGYPITSRVDIYDVATNTWSTAELSHPRAYLAAATLGNKIFFAGGLGWSSPNYGGVLTALDVVDIYDDNSHSWTTASLSVGRYELTATAVGSKIYFAGGIYDSYSISSAIDIYDSDLNTWSTMELQQPRTGHVGILAGDKIIWAGGR